MGKLILCTGKMAREPYRLLTGQKLFSVEELCLYVCQNYYEVEEDFFQEKLFAWMETECGCPEAAEKQRELTEQAYPLRDRIVALLCSTDYYTEQEITELIEKLRELSAMPDWKRGKRLADEYLKKGYYSRARLTYEKILGSCDAEEERGSLLHNIGIAKLHTTSPADAAECFLTAYRLGHHPESIKLCLFACKLGGLVSEYRRIVKEEELSREFLHIAEGEWNRCLSEADETAGMKMLDDIIREKERGLVSEAYDKLEGIVEMWKKEYREGAVR